MAALQPDKIVDFVVLGAMKSGTTWVDSMLRHATDAQLPATTKELFFFDRNWDRGLDWYASQWGRANDRNGPRGEVSSTYYASSRAVQNMYDVQPDARLIAILREPVTRSWSHYRHLVRKGEIDAAADYHATVERFPEIITWSDYDRLLRPWEQRFQRKVLRLRFEQLETDPAGFAAAIGSEMGLAVDPTKLPGVENAGQVPHSRAIAQIAARTSAVLHTFGLHGVVALAKRSGISKMLERPATTADRVVPEPFEALVRSNLDLRE